MQDVRPVVRGRFVGASFGSAVRASSSDSEQVFGGQVSERSYDQRREAALEAAVEYLGSRGLSRDVSYAALDAFGARALLDECERLRAALRPFVAYLDAF